MARPGGEGARLRFAGTTAAAISDNTYLTLIGSAYEEGSGEPNSNSRNPVKDFNYTQIFKTAYEVTNTANATRARTGNVLNNDKKRKSFDHARAIEQAMFWGARSESVGPNNKPLRTMGGIRQSIPADNTTILGANWGMVNSASAGNNFLDALEPIFSFASGAGDERVAFCGIPVMNAINRAIAENSGAAGFDLQLGSKEKVWGMNFQEILLPQGRLLLKRHPLMSRHALYKYSMFLLDFSNIEYVSLKGRDTKEKDNIQTKGEDVVRGMWQSEVSLCVKQMGQTQGYIGGFNQDPA